MRCNNNLSHKVCCFQFQNGLLHETVPDGAARTVMRPRCCLCSAATNVHVWIILAAASPIKQPESDKQFQGQFSSGLEIPAISSMTTIGSGGKKPPVIGKYRILCHARCTVPVLDQFILFTDQQSVLDELKKKPQSFVGNAVRPRPVSAKGLKGSHSILCS